MKLKILSRRTLLIAVFTGLALFAVLLFYFIHKNPVKGDSVLPLGSVVASPLESATVSPKQEQPSFGLPVRLKIPAINVDSTVEYVGLTADGAMGVPKGPDNVAWLKLGTRPGESGSAVIAGHYGVWKNGKATVFNDLNKLHTGDKLYIEDDKGTTITFVVRESRSYDPNADASAVFSSDDGKSHLNLITCEGSWNEGSQSYSKRLVIFTDKE